MIHYDQAQRRHTWLLDLTVGGIEFRFAEHPLVVLDDDGDEIVYQEGLSPLSMSLVQDGSANISVGIEVTCDEDWALLQARGYPIQRSRGVLRSHHVGQAIGEARVYLRGLAADVTHGEAGETLAFALERNPAKECDVIPASWETATDITWPVRVGGQILSGKIEGQPYPIVIGYPGDRSDSPNPVEAVEPVVPALMVEWKVDTADSRLLLGAGHLSPPAVSSRIRNDTTDTEANSGTTGYTVDKLGRDVTYCSFTGFAESAGFGPADSRWFAGFGWDGGGGSYRGGGIQNPFASGVLSGAGDVLAWALLTHSTVAFDRGMHWSFRDWLNQYRVDTWINKQTNTWRFVESLLKWLPVSVREGRDGLYFLPTRWDYTQQDIVAYLSTERREISRASDFTQLRQDIRNEITVNFAPTRSGGFYKSVTLTAPGRGPNADTQVESTILSRLSQDRYDVMPHVLDLHQTYSTATARAVAHLMLRRYAWPKRAIRYRAGREWEALDPGSCVAITDPSLHLRDALAIVSDLTIEGSGVALDLTLLDNPLLDGQPI